MGTKWEQEPKSCKRIGRKLLKVRHEWEQSRNKKPKKEKMGTKVGTRTPKWDKKEQRGNKNPKVGKWEQSRNKNQKWQKNGTGGSKNPKVRKEWEQSGIRTQKWDKTGNNVGTRTRM